MTTNQLTTEFEKARPRLRSYLVCVTANVADTNDILQDTYIKAFENLSTFRAEGSLQTWLFAIATNLAREHQRARRPWSETIIPMPSQDNFGINAHIATCFTFIAKSLPLEQQICLLLKEVYEFKVDEIRQIMVITDAMVKYYLQAGRSKMIHLFEDRCSLINKQGICNQCPELIGIFHPQQQVQEQLAKISLVREAGTADKERLFQLRMQIVRDASIE